MRREVALTRSGFYPGYCNIKSNIGGSVTITVRSDPTQGPNGEECGSTSSVTYTEAEFRRLFHELCSEYGDL